MVETKLCLLLWRWGAWCETGATGIQVVSWLKERTAKTSLNASFERDGDCVEYRIEKAVSDLFKVDASAAKVIRREYSTRHQRVSQTGRALAMKMALRTYQRKLKKGREYIALAINEVDF